MLTSLLRAGLTVPLTVNYLCEYHHSYGIIHSLYQSKVCTYLKCETARNKQWDEALVGQDKSYRKRWLCVVTHFSCYMQHPKDFLESVAWHELSEERYLTYPRGFPIRFQIRKLDDPHIHHRCKKTFHF